MARELRMPHHLEAPFVRVDDHSMQDGPVLGFRAVIELGSQTEADPRQLKTKIPGGGHVVQLHDLTPIQESIGLLVGRSALVEAIIEVIGNERLSCIFPLLVIGASQFNARRPMSRDWPESRRKAAPPILIWNARIFDVGRSLIYEVFLAGRKAGSNGVSQLPIVLFGVGCPLVRSS